MYLTNMGCANIMTLFPRCTEKQSRGRQRKSSSYLSSFSFYWSISRPISVSFSGLHQQIPFKIPNFQNPFPESCSWSEIPPKKQKIILSETWLWVRFAADSCPRNLRLLFWFRPIRRIPRFDAFGFWVFRVRPRGGAAGSVAAPWMTRRRAEMFSLWRRRVSRTWIILGRAPKEIWTWRRSI